MLYMPAPRENCSYHDLRIYNNRPSGLSCRGRLIVGENFSIDLPEETKRFTHVWLDISDYLQISAICSNVRDLIYFSQIVILLYQLYIAFSKSSSFGLFCDHLTLRKLFMVCTFCLFSSWQDNWSFDKRVIWRQRMKKNASPQAIAVSFSLFACAFVVKFFCFFFRQRPTRTFYLMGWMNIASSSLIQIDKKQFKLSRLKINNHSKFARDHFSKLFKFSNRFCESFRRPQAL